ncbi:MAG: NAD(P)/FAD-dependent oxidoreductase [Candidatus Micrarchaeota archaeon]|nr:NAD(P)/FAD-dependent oxidoreductase [Candidatus Micrarchaeota archaeon]
MYDMHIVGGGPAGCFAGISAVQQGKKVLLSEEHKRIGEPEACSGLVSKSGLEALSSYVDYRKAKINEIKSAKIVCGKEEIIVRPKKESAVVICRKEFDRMAAERFVEEGGKLELGKKVTRKFQARTVVGADGPASAIAEHFGFPRIEKYVATLQGEFSYRCQDKHQTELYFSSEHFPGFFGWIIPINEEEAKIGLGVRLPLHPLIYYKRFLSRLGIKEAKFSVSAVIPIQMRRQTAIERGGYRVALVGDAAGQVKATTGGGIFFGASCGILAGKYAQQPAKYESEWKKSYWLDLALHQQARAILDIWGGQPPSLLVRAAKMALFDELIEQEGKMDRWSQMVSPQLPLAYGKIVLCRLFGVKT